MATRVSVFAQLTRLFMVITWARTIVPHSYHRRDLNRLLRGVNYVQPVFTQTGYVDRGSASRLVQCRVNLDFFHLLSDPADESAAIGPTPQGPYGIDCERFQDRAFWKAFPADYVHDIDLPDGAPEVALDRNGHVIRWSIHLGLLLYPA